MNVVTGVEQFEVPSAAEASLPENWELRTSRSSGSGPGGDRARSDHSTIDFESSRGISC